MRLVVPAIALAAFALTACSEKTQDNAKEMAQSAAADTAANAQQVLDKGAEAAGKAADDLAQKADQTSAQNDMTPAQDNLSTARDTH